MNLELFVCPDAGLGSMDTDSRLVPLESGSWPAPDSRLDPEDPGTWPAPGSGCTSWTQPSGQYQQPQVQAKFSLHQSILGLQGPGLCPMDPMPAHLINPSTSPAQPQSPGTRPAHLKDSSIKAHLQNLPDNSPTISGQGDWRRPFPA